MSQEQSNLTRRALLDSFKLPEEEIERYLTEIDREYPNDDDIKRVEIIILKYKNKDIEKECLARLIDYTDHPFKLTFFDNRNMPKNMSRAWNKLIREATCELVVVMDTDALVTEGWIKPLVNAMNERDCAIAAPVAGHRTHIVEDQRRDRGTEPHFIATDHVSGFCFMTKKSIVKELGWFDEDFLVFGQDSDFTWRIIESDKYNCYVCPQSLVHHGLPNYDNMREGSTETSKAGKDNEFNYNLDVAYAPKMVNIKRDARTNPR